MKYDLLVLGGGPGGYVAAFRAAQKGLKVALVEKEMIGGTCLNYGCIPTKALIRSAEILETVRRSGEFGVTIGDLSFDFSAVSKRKDSVTKLLREGVEGLVAANKIDLHRGFGKLIEPKKIEISNADGKQVMISFDKLIIATGSEPVIPPVPGVDLPGVITSKEALALTSLPEELCIVGGGVIGMEFAYIMNSFGVKITVLEMLPQFLPFADSEMVQYLLESFKNQGVSLISGARVTSIDEGPTGLTVSYTKDDLKSKVNAGLVLMAVGRSPNLSGTEGLGLKQTENNGIAVNAAMEAEIPGIYAIGDCTGGVQLAHVASAQGLVAAENAAGGKVNFNSSSIPFCIYSRPEMAWVGLTEQQAREKYGQVKIGRFPLTGNGKALVLGDTFGMVKLIIDDKYGEIVGLHLIGPEAANMIAEGVLARMLEATATELASAIHPHPTLSEALMEAAQMALGHGIHYI